MTRTGYDSLIEHYENCLAAHGDTHLGVDWPSAQDAKRRYQVMLELMPQASREQPATVLDFGCGAGHLWEFIQRQERDDIEYYGVDASPKFIELCRSKFPAQTFQCIDVLRDEAPLPEADFVIMNGVLTEKRGLSFDEMYDFMTDLLPRVFAAARVGMAFNVMSQHVDWQRDDLFHLPFDALAAFLKRRVSRHFQFRADYGLYEYTTYVYREPK